MGDEKIYILSVFTVYPASFRDDFYLFCYYTDGSRGLLHTDADEP
jgi:hypothetical protein